MGVRHKGREAALRLLYQIDASGDLSSQARADFWSSHGNMVPETEFADGLVDAVLAKADSLDAEIDAALENWQVERLARVDLLVLRLAVCELLDPGDVPAEVIIDEAIEIAKTYSDPDSCKFINGVLDRVAREHGLVDKMAR
jgi:N utilization substance protein B